MHPMNMLKPLIASVLLTVGCGGSKKPVTEPAPAPSEPAPADPAPAPAEPAPPEPTPEAAKPAPPPAAVLATGAGKVKITGKGGMTIDLAIKADGTFTTMATQPKKGKKPAVKKAAGKLAERTAALEGAESARLAEDGTVTVLQGMKEIRDGKVVKDETTWGAVGTLDDAGVFTLASDSSKVSFGDDGKAVGFPADMTVTFEGPPELRRTAIFLVVAMMAGGKTVMESGSATAPGNATAPVPAPPPKK